jgi:hypothetical protein
VKRTRRRSTRMILWRKRWARGWRGSRWPGEEGGKSVVEGEEADGEEGA